MKFSFDLENINMGSASPPGFIRDGQIQEEIEFTTNAQGRLASPDGNNPDVLTILSSQMISEIPLKAEFLFGDEVEEAARIPCAFGSATTTRLYGVRQFSQGFETDTGWVFDNRNSGMLTDAGSILIGRVHLKFQRDPSVVRDQNYFIANGIAVPTYRPGETNPNIRSVDGVGIQRLSDADNWRPVRGHRLKLQLRSVSGPRLDRNVAPIEVALDQVSDRRRFVYFCDENGNPYEGDAMGEPLFVDAERTTMKSVPIAQVNWSTFIPTRWIYVTTQGDPKSLNRAAHEFEGSAAFRLRGGADVFLCESINLSVFEKTQQQAAQGP